MNIARIADIADGRTGGMSRAIYSTGEALVRRGHKVDYLFRPHLHVRGPVALRRFTVPLSIPSMIQRLIRRGHHYDLVEIHEPLGAVYCFLRERGVKLPPVVIYSHGLEEHMNHAELRYRHQKGLPISVKKRISPLTVVRQAQYAVRHGSHVLCCSHEDVRYLTLAGVPPYQITKVHNGITPEFLNVGHRLVRHNQDIIQVLFLGSWLTRKGILDVVPTMTSVLREYSHLRFTIAGSGGGADKILSGFPEDLHSRITVIPKIVNDDTLLSLYSQHEIFFLPSFFEGQPLVMIEAAAMGLAVVTTNICGMADFIVHEKNGLLVSVGDTTAMIDSLRRLVNDPALRQMLGETARQTAQKYTWESAADKIEQAYIQAIH